MGTINWQSSDGVTLKSLRQSAGIGLSVLAKKAALSTEQLIQLEEGGSNLFYSESIKLRAGERVLEILGFKFTSPPRHFEDTTPLASENRIIPANQKLKYLGNWIDGVFQKIANLFKSQDSRAIEETDEHFSAHFQAQESDSGSNSYLLRLWRSTVLWSVMGGAAIAIIIYDFYSRYLSLIQRF